MSMTPMILLLVIRSEICVHWMVGIAWALFWLKLVDLVESIETCEVVKKLDLALI